jgi:class 3 adenylate cyclase
MPKHRWIDDDFAAFRAGLLSVTPSVPLQLNLRAIMGPALGKLRWYSKATVAFHFFTNPSHKEVHVMTCGAAEATAAVLSSERLRRSEGTNFVPSDDLPLYYRKVLDSQESVERLFKTPEMSRDEEYKCCLRGPLLAILRDLAQNKRFSAEFEGRTPGGDDLVIVLPLQDSKYPRLGHFVLWSPGDDLRFIADCTPDRKIRSMFQARMRQIIVRLFTNYYRMGPETCLPTYYLPGQKDVTLLSAEIGGFQKVWEQVRQLPLIQEAHAQVRLSLVNEFSTIAADAIGQCGGRIDQNWGSGFLAVFGEYPGDPESSPRISLIEALTTASLLVENFSDYAQKWMERHFGEHTFITVPPTPRVGIGIHRAPVLFDYFGSADHHTFLAVGDHVSFVKTLASIAGTSDEFREKPILLHHSAEKHARDVLTKTKDDILTISGVPGPIRVFPISRENLLLEPNPPRRL